MVFTRKKEQQNKKLFSQLNERYTGFMIEQSNQDEQIENRDNMLRRGTSLDNASNPAQFNYPQVDVHTLEENIVSKVRSEVDNVMTSVQTRVQNLVFPRVELAMKSANAQSERSIDGNVSKPDQRDFLGLRMTASSKIKSQMDLN